ncbi:MAG: family 16 glycosylhydrolase, partial [Capsulimonadaceae bacterium]
MTISKKRNGERFSLITLLLALSGILLGAAVRPACATPPAGYTLAWSDEFNGAVGSSPNPANWIFDTGGGGWGNGELETYTTSTANAEIISDPNATDGLALQITAIDTNGGVGTAGNYTSARLQSSGLVSAGFGYIEIRAKAPYGQGIWPAVWMMGNDYSTSGWPTCGEQDIFEMFCQNDGTNMTSWHMNYLGNESDWTASYTLADGALFDGAYHLFGLLTTQQGLTAYVDGNEFESHGNADSPGFIFNHPFFFLINLAVGGTPPGDPNSTTVFPQMLDVDYIRYYTAPVGSEQYGTVSPGYGTVVDTCNNLATLYNTSGNWVIDNSNPSYFNGDTARLCRTYNGTEWINYKYTNISSASTTIGVYGTNNTAVTLWYSTNNGTSYTQAASTNSAITPTTSGWGLYTVSTSGLPAGVTDLQIQVAPTTDAWDHEIAGVTITSSSTVASPPSPVPLVATPGSGQVTLNWPPTSGATTYNIYQSTTAYAEIGSAPYATNITTNSYTNTGLTNGTAYYYQVAAVNSAGTSPQSAQAAATPGVDAAPNSLTATAGNAQIALSWPAGGEATSYNIYRGTATGAESATAIVTGVTATSYTDTGVANGTGYFYKVQSDDSAGTSGMSIEATAVPAAGDGAPVAPTSLTTIGGSAEVTVTWTDTTGAASYNVFRSTASGGEGTTAYATGVTAPIFADTSVASGTTYYYTVAALNNYGSSAQSSQASGTPSGGSGAPGAPFGLSATGGNAQVALVWSGGSGATSYNVYRGKTSGGESAPAIASVTTTTRYTDTTVTNGTA